VKGGITDWCCHLGNDTNDRVHRLEAISCFGRGLNLEVRDGISFWLSESLNPQSVATKQYRNPLNGLRYDWWQITNDRRTMLWRNVALALQEQFYSISFAEEEEDDDDSVLIYICLSCQIIMGPSFLEGGPIMYRSCPSVCLSVPCHNLQGKRKGLRIPNLVGRVPGIPAPRGPISRSRGQRSRSWRLIALLSLTSLCLLFTVYIESLTKL